jgi:hypothetical protein
VGNEFKLLTQASQLIKEVTDDIALTGRALTQEEITALGQMQVMLREMRDDIIRNSAFTGGKLAELFNLTPGRVSQIRGKHH